jgi:hypothetical protein
MPPDELRSGEVRLVAISEDVLTPSWGKCSVCGREFPVNGEDDYHLIAHDPPGKLIPIRTFTVYDLPVEAWEHAITEGEAYDGTNPDLAHSSTGEYAAKRIRAPFSPSTTGEASDG